MNGTQQSGTNASTELTVQLKSFDYRYSGAVGLGKAKFAETWEGARALKIPALRISKGELVWLHGPSGCGKTTMLNLIAGFLTPPPEHVTVLNQDMGQLRQSQRHQQSHWRMHTIGIVPQEPLLIDSLSAWQNAVLPAQLAGLDKLDFVERVEQLFARLSIDSVRLHLPSQLSRGQQQRVAIARAFANQSRLILADEPTANLDDANVHSVMTLIQQLVAEQGACAIVASHDARIAPYCTSRMGFNDA